MPCLLDDKHQAAAQAFVFMFILQEATQKLYNHHSTLRTPSHSTDNLWAKPNVAEHII
jgi:hypothetical protein